MKVINLLLLLVDHFIGIVLYNYKPSHSVLLKRFNSPLWFAIENGNELYSPDTMQLSAGDRFSQIFIGEFPVCNRGRSSCRPEKLVLRGFRQRWPAMLYSQIGTYRLNNVDQKNGCVTSLNISRLAGKPDTRSVATES